MGYFKTKVEENVYRITEVQNDFHVNMYLVVGSERSLLIDGGDSGDDLSEMLLGSSDTTMLITHGHGDHAKAMNQFEEVYLSHIDVQYLNEIWNLEVKKEDVIDVDDNTSFDLGDRKLEVLTLPGHTPGSIVLLDRKNELLFSSDSIGSGGLWMQLPHSGLLKDYLVQLKKLNNIISEWKNPKIFVGHTGVDESYYGYQYMLDLIHLVEGLVNGTIVGKPQNPEDQFFGGYKASYGVIGEIMYRPEKLK